MIDYQKLQQQVLNDLSASLKTPNSDDPYTGLMKLIHSQIALAVTSAIKEYDRQKNL